MAGEWLLSKCRVFSWSDETGEAVNAFLGLYKSP
jgi:hypothetical protein